VTQLGCNTGLGSCGGATAGQASHWLLCGGNEDKKTKK